MSRLPGAIVPPAIVAATALSYLIAFAIGIPLLVPFLNVAAGFPFMVGSLKRGATGEAIWRMLIWAAALAVCATLVSYFATTDAARMFLRGESYRAEMFEFIRTGHGREGDIRAFLPQHALHAIAFSLLAVATGAVLAMPLGAFLMNYMAYYVGALAAASVHPWKAIVLAWVPWAVIRVMSFVTIGVVLGGPVLSRVARFPYRLSEQRRWLWLAALGLLVDVVMKWALAPWWRHLLQEAAGW
jgi:hypothetical protein